MTQFEMPFEGAGAPAVRGRPVIASISGGKDSAAMALWLKEQELPHRRIFMDTGWEHPITYEFLRGPLTAALGPIEEIGGERDGQPIDFVGLVRRKGLFPSRRMRFCTEELKVKPAQRYIQRIQDELGDVINAVGIRRDESQARSKMAEWEWSETFDCWVWRPIVTWSKDDVLAIHRRHGLPLNPLYEMGASRVGCWPCIHARKSEIALVAAIDPDRIALIAELEAELNQRGAERDRAMERAFMPRSMFWYHSQGPNVPITIHETVEWARSGRGEWQPPGAQDGCARFGVCAVEPE